MRAADGLWFGGSDVLRDRSAVGAEAVLNVARDLAPGEGLGWVGWDYLVGVEYAQVGLVDGPGNDAATYVAAVLALVDLRRRHDAVAVYDHNGGRALAVCAMYLNLVGGRRRGRPTEWSHWLTWEERLAEIEAAAGLPLPEAHPAHASAFAALPFGLLEVLL